MISHGTPRDEQCRCSSVDIRLVILNQKSFVRNCLVLYEYCSMTGSRSDVDAPLGVEEPIVIVLRLLSLVQRRAWRHTRIATRYGCRQDTRRIKANLYMLGVRRD